MCDLETSRIGAPYIYDISNLRVKEELYDLYEYFSPSIIRVIISRRMRWVGHLARMGYRRAAFRDLVGKPRRSYKDNVKMDF